jgi:NAD(P)-dependent dehydrogenase (short-subunit alcohol dehydrogenase family)
MENRKTAIITGASRGIGRAVAARFAREGYRLVLADLDTPALQETGAYLVEQMQAECLLCPGDLADTAYAKSITGSCLQHWGRIDVLVNNAAWRTIGTMRTIEPEAWERTLRVCLTAPAFLAKWCAAAMEEHRTGGAIINISSVMAGRAAGYSPAYIAAKGAMKSLTYELAVTYGRSNIRVAGVCPGYIDTEMSNDYTDKTGKNISSILTDDLCNAIPLGRGGLPEEVAAAVYWLCSPEAAYITGATLLVDGGFAHNFNDYPIKKLQFPEEF